MNGRANPSAEVTQGERVADGPSPAGRTGRLGWPAPPAPEGGRLGWPGGYPEKAPAG